jgi:dipeptidase D
MSIQNLEPRHLWNHFDRIRSIPRPSRHEEKIREHLLAWAKERGFATRVDKVGNIVVTVPATKGHEKAPVLIAGHMDMVCEKMPTFVRFRPTPSSSSVTATGSRREAHAWRRQRHRAAAAFAVADDAAVVHGPLELLITMDEETGLTGAAELDPSLVGGRRMLNLDSEELYAIYIGCSGGGNSVFTLPVEGEAPARGARTVEVAVTGLKGGHSGMEIQLQRGNAIRLLARILRAVGADIRIDKIDGGNAHNAIPREARAVLTLPAQGLDAPRNAVAEQSVAIKEELAVSDAGVTIAVNDVSATHARVMKADSTRRVIGMLTSLPHGVDAMSLDVPGLVETSSNLAAVKTEGDSVTVLMSVRSSIRSSLIALRDRAKLRPSSRARASSTRSLPGWKPNLKSEVLGKAKRVHKEQLGREPHLMAIHAGLECGVIGEKYPGMDMISFGPTIEGPHSPDERVNIPSVETFWKFLSALVTELA